jgi:hypothetical protein
MKKIKDLNLFYYLFSSVRACSACWIEQNVMRNIDGKNEEKKPPGKGSTDRRIRNTVSVEETEWELAGLNNVALDTDQWLIPEKTEIILWDP